MTVFCDTSVLAASCVRRHPHYARARPVLVDVRARRMTGIMGAHSVAEVYSALTTMPVEPRILPSEAAVILNRNVIPFFHVQPATTDLYRRAVANCARHALPGGKVYDALLIECARDANCDRVYTFNQRDFELLAPDYPGLVMAP